MRAKKYRKFVTKLKRQNMSYRGINETTTLIELRKINQKIIITSLGRKFTDASFCNEYFRTQLRFLAISLFNVKQDYYTAVAKNKGRIRTKVTSTVLQLNYFTRVQMFHDETKTTSKSSFPVLNSRTEPSRIVIQP